MSDEDVVQGLTTRLFKYSMISGIEGDGDRTRTVRSPVVAVVTSLELTNRMQVTACLHEAAEAFRHYLVEMGLPRDWRHERGGIDAAFWPAATSLFFHYLRARDYGVTLFLEGDK